jgi:short-subunit dehydrogenase
MAREGDGKTALVTGASAGIGGAFAELLASKGYGVVLVARRAERLDALAASLRERHGVATHVIVSDLSQPSAPAQIADRLQQDGLHVDFLVNNAGYGVAGAYVNVPWLAHQHFLQVMVTAVCDLTYRLLPPMLDRGWGRIINIASVAGMVPAPAGHTLYGASKAFVIRFSESLSAENTSRGVHVTAVSPGFTYSEFHDVLGTREKMKSIPAPLWLKADAVAREGYNAVMNGSPVVINGRAYRALVWLASALPKGVVRWASSRSGRRYRKT